ncbi:MAG: hypothetical protein ABL888_04760 [Pirellulaceae bacterium]
MPYDLFISYSRRYNVAQPDRPRAGRAAQRGNWLHVLASTRLGANGDILL